MARSSGGLLSRAIGRPVSIGGAAREELFSFTPTVTLRDVLIGQPAWAGGGDLARVARLRVRFPAAPMLLGRFRPQAVEVEGAALSLVRDADGRTNWESAHPSRGGDGPRLSRLVIKAGRLTLADAVRHVRLAGTFSSDVRAGLVVDGRGTFRDRPLRLAVRGAPIDSDRAGPWPAAASIRSPLVTLSAALVMDRPLDTRHFGARLDARAEDLSRVDDLIQAGLFPTQPLALRGRVRRDGDTWRIKRLGGTIGRSRLTMTATVDR